MLCLDGDYLSCCRSLILSSVLELLLMLIIPGNLIDVFLLGGMIYTVGGVLSPEMRVLDVTMMLTLL